MLGVDSELGPDSLRKLHADVECPITKSKLLSAELSFQFVECSTNNVIMNSITFYR